MLQEKRKFKRRVRERMMRVGEGHTRARRSERFTSMAGLGDVVTFCESSWGLGLRLHPVQRVVLKVTYGLRLDDEHRFGVRVDPDRLDEETSFTEASYLRWLYEQGRSNVKESPEEPCGEAVWVMGRLAGKSTLALAMMAYETCGIVARKDPQRYFGLSPSSRIQLTHMSESEDMAREFWLDFSRMLPEGVRGHEEGDGPDLSVCLSTASAIEGGVSRRGVMAKFSDYGAGEVRGAGNFFVVLDDVEYAYDGGRMAAHALTTSLATFTKKGSCGEVVGNRVEGRLLVASAPLPQSGGILRDRYTAAMGGRGCGAVCLRIPTWEMNPVVASSALREERHREGFWTEWGAAL